MSAALTGGRVNYYLAQVDHPQREEQPAYQAECEDIIQALRMDFNEACEFKAIWRTASARLGNGKSGQKAKYDAEKRVHYAKRSLKHIENLELGDVKREPSKEDSVAWFKWTGVVTLEHTVLFASSTDRLVEVQLRDGTKTTGRTRSFDWDLHGNDRDIVKYRVID